MSVAPDEVVVTAGSAADVTLTTRVGDREVVTTGPHHVAHVTGLAPGTEYTLEVSDVEPHPYLPTTVRTLASPRGRLLATVATANDVHFGETVCGRRPVTRFRTPRARCSWLLRGNRRIRA